MVWTQQQVMQVGVKMKYILVYLLLTIPFILQAEEPTPVKKQSTGPEFLRGYLKADCIPMSDRCNINIIKDVVDGIEKEIDLFWRKDNAEITPVVPPTRVE